MIKTRRNKAALIILSITALCLCAALLTYYASGSVIAGSENLMNLRI